METKHLLHLCKLTPDEKTEGGMRIKANKKNFPVLEGMSIYKLILHENGVREPHWHANADEMGYCVKGEVVVNIYNTGDTRSFFLVKEGEVFWIPSGALHDIENVGEGQAELILTFSHEDVEDFNLSTTLSLFSDAVLGNTWNVKKEVFEDLPKPKLSAFAALRKSLTKIPDETRYSTPFRYNLEGSQPILINEGGSARVARENVWPLAKTRALYSLKLTGIGMREPHWHPETAELGYVKQGTGRMSIYHPSGKVDTFQMQAGDVYYIPKAYPHHIENLTNDLLHILVFFDQGMPKDIGFTGSIHSYSDDVLASITKATPEFFHKLPKYYADSFIVKKTNRVD